MFPLLLMPDCSPPKPLSRFGVDAGRLSPALIAGQAAFLFSYLIACRLTPMPSNSAVMVRANPDQCPLIALPGVCPCTRDLRQAIVANCTADPLRFLAVLLVGKFHNPRPAL